ncbi:hypothetical protein HYFRA_00009847 [Hymenoscyphus fraxineus]|uniref:Malate dehydrogenase n=1 Tax=Hymenoscyphus fraxineus TaxID=746836 RepID=A0A9N9L6P9_9HELO|nr:hypothetical protein HYFRA_00009847 [Hymenoscyphus fraxineus]
MLFHYWVSSALCAVALAAPSLAPPSPEAALVLREYFEALASETQEVKRAEKKETDKKETTEAVDTKGTTETADTKGTTETADTKKTTEAADTKGTTKVADTKETTKAADTKKTTKAADTKGGPGCDTSKAKLPSSSLPGPSGTLKFIGLGSGVQKYTCKANDAAAVPVSAGAVASLGDGTCTGAKSRRALELLPRLAMEYDIQALIAARAGGGKHFFNSAGAPVFETPAGTFVGSKSASADSPKKGSVAWLKLSAIGGTTSGLSEAYRVNTNGGSPPATCADSAASFEVKYSAEYWFFG